MDFEHPTLQGVNAMAIRNPRVSLRLPWLCACWTFSPPLPKSGIAVKLILKRASS